MDRAKKYILKRTFSLTVTATFISTMVNLVVRHQEEQSTQVGLNGNKSPASAGRAMPSSPVSPLTQHESMFATDSPPFSGHVEQRDQPPVKSASSTTSLEMECDYDKSVTQLYEMLESSKWEEACARCQTHPEEVHTWVARRDANGDLRWKLLPLHAAIIFEAPLSLIEELLSTHPLAVAKRDDQGILPLHLAFRHQSRSTVIKKLVQQYPVGVTLKDNRGRIPLDHGKDMSFSANFLELYAEAFRKCQHIETKETENKPETVATYENRMAALKDAYEARITALIFDHEKLLQTMITKAENDCQRTKNDYTGEILELKAQLAREKMITASVPELEAEVKGLSSSLRTATSELMSLRRIVEKQTEQQENMVGEIRRSLKDQKALNDRCNKQQEQLEQAKKLREQLLRTLIQKDNGKSNQISTEICQQSENNIARTEKLLNSLTLNPSDRRLVNNTRRSIPPNPNNQDNNDHPSDCENPSWSAEPADDHGDDISAITESSYLRAFGDR